MWGDAKKNFLGGVRWTRSSTILLTCPLSIPPRDTLIPPRIRRGPAVVPPDTCLIPPRIRGGLTMSNDDVIMIDS